jgi:quinol monooxygenase YgiN
LRFKKKAVVNPVSRKTGRRHHFVWMERWDDPEALTIYRKSDPFRMLMGAIDVLGKLVELRHVSYD